MKLLKYFATKCGLISTQQLAEKVGGNNYEEESALLKQLEAKLKQGMSGAEIENLCREATLSQHKHQFAKLALST